MMKPTHQRMTMSLIRWRRCVVGDDPTFTSYAELT